MPEQSQNPSSQPSKPSDYAMVRAIDLRDAEMLEMLLDHGGNVNATNENNSTLLILAAISDEPDMVRVLINHGAALDHENLLGHTALICVAKLERYDEGKEAQLETTRLLLAAGAALEPLDFEGMTALDQARDYGNDEIADMIFKAGEDRLIAAKEKARQDAEEVRLLAVTQKQQGLKQQASKVKLKPGLKTPGPKR